MSAIMNATTTPGATARSLWSRFGRQVALGVLGFAVLAAAFEVLSRFELVNPKLFPPPSVVLPRAATLLIDPGFLADVGATVLATLVGFAIAFCVAVPLGLLVGSYWAVSAGIMPMVDFLRSIPGIAIIPLLVLTLGQGIETKVAIVVFVTVWPMLLNAIYGVRSVDRVALETARSFRTSMPRTWFRIVLPSALPLILTGARIAMSLGLAVTIATEITIGTQDGIGRFILYASYSGTDHQTVFAAVVLAGVLGLLLSIVTSAITHRAVAWERKGVK